MESSAEQTIFGVLLWQASSNGKKNFSTWTRIGLGSGKTENDDTDPEDGDEGELDDACPPLIGNCSSSTFSASSQAPRRSLCEDLFISLWESNVLMALRTYIFCFCMTLGLTWVMRLAFVFSSLIFRCHRCQLSTFSDVKTDRNLAPAGEIHRKCHSAFGSSWIISMIRMS